MHTVNGVGCKLSAEWMVSVEISGSIEPNGGLVRPFYQITLVREDCIRLGLVGNQDGLECVGLAGEHKDNLSLCSNGVFIRRSR